MHVASITPVGPGKVVYAPLPFFHTSALFTGLASALHAGAAIGSRAKFSASQTHARHPPDGRGDAHVHRQGPQLHPRGRRPHPTTPTSPLELAIGNEASESDIREFAARFDCQVRDSYGSTEGMIIIRRDATMPRGSIGRGDETIRVFDPETRARSARPPSSTREAASLNGDIAVGEIVNTAPGSGFEGYYRNEEALASKVRDGVYYSGDLAYRDADGWFFFAGRSNEWLRVDGENFAAGPVEAIVLRYPQRAVGRGLRRTRRPGRRPRDGGDRSRRPRRVRRRRLRRLPRAATRPRTEVAAELRAAHRRAAEAREHEARQDPPPR